MKNWGILLNGWASGFNAAALAHFISVDGGVGSIVLHTTCTVGSGLLAIYIAMEKN